MTLEKSKTNRRGFLAGTAGTAALAMTSFGTNRSFAAAESDSPKTQTKFNSFGLDGDRATFYSEKIKEPARILLIADTHLFMDDQRGVPFKQYSQRMSKAYNTTKHYSTGATTNPNESFEKTLQMAKNKKYDAVALLGDIVSFPSEAAIEWAVEKLERSGLPWHYISGNHDWHYEGTEGAEKDLRNEWTRKRLMPFFKDKNPLMYAVDIKGIRLVFIDDSIYQILPEQLEFFQKQVASGLPIILLMHIPMYAPGRRVGFGCGHPEWNAKSDKSWKIERREKWPIEGHSATTMEFYRSVFAAKNLLGIFTGHIHRLSLDTVNGIPQFVVPTNSNQSFLTAEFNPL